ncbi:hypothetical protein AAEJ42_21710, partial [Shewanella algae]
AEYMGAMNSSQIEIKCLANGMGPYMERRGFNRACVAVANKLARIAWVIAAKEETYRPAT